MGVRGEVRGWESVEKRHVEDEWPGGSVGDGRGELWFLLRSGEMAETTSVGGHVGSRRRVELRRAGLVRPVHERHQGAWNGYGNSPTTEMDGTGRCAGGLLVRCGCR